MSSTNLLYIIFARAKRLHRPMAGKNPDMCSDRFWHNMGLKSADFRDFQIGGRDLVITSILCLK